MGLSKLFSSLCPFHLCALGAFASPPMNENDLAKIIVDCAYKVHTTLGPGLLESVYEAALAYELEKRGL